LNHIHTERNYFDSMYEFWLKTFQTESNGGCDSRLLKIKMNKYYGFIVLFVFVLIFILFCWLLRRFYRNRQRYQTANNDYPSFLNT